MYQFNCQGLHVPKIIQVKPRVKQYFSIISHLISLAEKRLSGMLGFLLIYSSIEHIHEITTKALKICVA